MTTTDINAINRTLAEKVMGWAVTADGHKASDPGFIFEYCGNLWLESGCRFWSPATDRNDLAEVVAKLTTEQRTALMDRLARIHAEIPSDDDGFGFWLLTYDLAIVAKAVAEVVTGTPTP